MAIRLVVNLSAAKGKGDEFAKAFNGNVPNVRREPGCEEYVLFRSTENPEQFVLLERWTSAGHLEEHSKLLRSKPSATANLRGPEPTKAERYEV